jgi:hypothetical protein
MRRRQVAASFAAAIAVLLSACGRSKKGAMDEALKRDLAAVGGSSVELAPNAATQQMVVSAIEAGPTSAPVHTSARKPNAPKPVVQPPKRPVQSVAQAPTPAPSPAPRVTAPEPVEASPMEPAPLPPVQKPVVRQQPSRQTGPYKTEAEIFRQMPWIKP